MFYIILKINASSKIKFITIMVFLIYTIILKVKLGQKFCAMNTT